jgi:polysaccharide deacetylase 2 family uncharacterized protein YibQ
MLRRHLDGWLNHAGGRFSLGIGIGLLVGLIVVLGFNRFNHWVTQSPDDRLQATGELTAPAINDLGKPAESPQQSGQSTTTSAGPVGKASSAKTPSAKTLEQLITDSQSEITEPDAVSPSAPATAPVIQPTPPAHGTSTGSETVAALPTKPAPVTPPPREGGQPAWLRNAVVFHAPITGPMIAIVLDDVGVNKSDAELALDLPAPITLSMMTYADGVSDLAAKAHTRGHELLLHVPMQPVNPKIDPGPNALLVGLSPEELKRRLDWGLDRFSGFIGINNHMGSRFTQDDAGMRVVMHELQLRGLLFLDSRTISNSVGEHVASEIGVPHIGRDVFLDDDMSAASVTRQLALTERIAAKQGFVVAIGHPHPTTVAVLRKWMVEAKQRGFILVPLSTVARREIGVPG